jgi:hypothetical protein
MNTQDVRVFIVIESIHSEMLLVVFEVTAAQLLEIYYLNRVYFLQIPHDNFRVLFFA